MNEWTPVRNRYVEAVVAPHLGPNGNKKTRQKFEIQKNSWNSPVIYLWLQQFDKISIGNKREQLTETETKLIC